jgi:prepilin-type processing-associated H-X9-DG protein
MDERSIAFYGALSHTAWGMVPVLTAVGLGFAAYRVEQRWRQTRHHQFLLGLVSIWIMLLTSLWLIFAGVFHIACAATKAKETKCLANLMQLGTATMMYVQDHNETLPPAENWEDALKPYLKTSLRCPSVKLGMSYAMNKALSKKKLEELERPADVVLFFESDNGTTVAQRRHGSNLGFTFADGHAKRISKNNQKVLVWDIPKTTTKASQR